MPDKPLAGVGVLVTRPREQAADLVDAIENAGGQATLFPVLEIEARPTNAIQADADALPAPDIVIFVSTNAVRYGKDFTGDADVAAVGPATTNALQDAGINVDIRSGSGFDSEHLLDESALRDVRGRQVRIIRGDAGRELLADTLRERGANVTYLPVYSRRLPSTDAATLSSLENAWSEINVVTVMSVQSLDNLLALLPPSCRDRMPQARLVSPAKRVIKEALDRLPGVRTTLAAGPQANDVLDAIIAATTTRSEAS